MTGLCLDTPQTTVTIRMYAAHMDTLAHCAWCAQRVSPTCDDTGENDVDLDKPGDHPVDVPIICVLTRFGLRSARHNHLNWGDLDLRRFILSMDRPAVGRRCQTL